MKESIWFALVVIACGLSFDAAASPGAHRDETALTCGRAGEVIRLAEDYAKLRGNRLEFQGVFRSADEWQHAKYGNGEGAALISCPPRSDVIILSRHTGGKWQRRGTCQIVTML